MKRNINLVVFTERYWDYGLIYSQNILPLVNLSKKENVKIRLISFTSLPLLFLDRVKIKKTTKELESIGISVINFPVLFYPTKLMILHWWLIPFYYLNIIFYILFLNYYDQKAKCHNLYSIRSYQAALGFLKFYKFKHNVIFDPRTDWITENINVGTFKSNSYTVKKWIKIEKEMLNRFKKTIFISDIFKKSILERHKLEDNQEKYVIVYNPINYHHFQFKNKTVKTNQNFLYTGSLGHWNNLEYYLDFFMALHPYFKSSKLIICTPSPARKIEPTLKSNKYSSIRKYVEVHYAVPTEELPQYYSKCHWGLQLMDKKDSRVGVKFIEYIASGVIPIINKNVEGAVMLSKKYNLGIVIDNEYHHNINNIVSRLTNAKIDINATNYLSFKKATDLESIVEIISPIYK